MQPIFTVALKGEPSPEMKAKLHRFLHFRYSGPRQKAYDPGCIAVSRVDRKTSLKLLAAEAAEPWRIVCLSSDPAIHKQPQPHLLGKPGGKSSLKVARLKPGTPVKTDQSASQAQKLESNLRDLLGDAAAD